MKIIGTTKYNTPCIWTCIGRGIQGISNYVDIPIVMYCQSEIENHKVIPDDDEVIIIFEAGCFQHAGWSLKKVKSYFPNSKLVVLAADTNIYLFIRKQHQIEYELVDLWLDLDCRCIKIYRDLGLKADLWMWTISDWLINHISAFNMPPEDKIYDFIGVYDIHSLNHGYRKRLVDFLKSHNCTFTNGGGIGHEDNDINSLLLHYNKSNFTLGTTSHNLADDFRTPKGFRDFIGPFTNSVLIYDNYPMIMEYYKDIVPYYMYDNFDSIMCLCQAIATNDVLKKQYLENQRQWAIDNTIDKQLYRMLQKYELIPSK